MTLLANIICIVVMIGIWLYVLAFLCKMPYSISYCLRRWIFQKDDKYIKWLWKNNIYLIYSVFLIFLLPIIALMLGSFMHNKIFDRPALLIQLSPFLWGLVWLIIYNRIGWLGNWVNKEL